MRTVKFRAWDKEKNVMWYDETKNLYNGKLHKSYGQNLMITMDGELRICQWYDTGVSMLSFGDWELMQFTGLQDKNGKDIYEGDIIQWKKSEQGKQKSFYLQIKRVVFHNGSFGFQEWHTDEDGKLKEKLSYHSAHYTTPDIYEIEFDLEVIGNIHENPELL